MPIAFNEAGLARLGRAMQLLAAPLDHASLDDWRHCVNEEVKELVGADSAGFLFTGVDGTPMLSRDHDVEELNRFPEMTIPSLANGGDPWERIVDLGAARLEDAYGPEYGRLYLRSSYHNEYAGANGAHDPLLLCTAIQNTTGPAGLACLHMWKASPRRTFGPREIAIMRLLMPAFRAGAQAQLRWSAHHHDLVHLLDGLGVVAIVWDGAGAVVHRTPAMGRILAADGAALAGPLAGTFGALQPLARSTPGGDALGRQCTREVRASQARYRVHGSLYGARHGGQPLIIATVECLTPSVRSADELRASHRLTPAECRVAHELALGRSNAAIADRLGVSPHTARRHTERVLAKLGARTRAEVVTLLRC